MLTRVALAMTLLILTGCSQSGPEEISRPVSIVNLLATPDVKGHFDAHHHGHFRLYPAALTELSPLEPWPPPSLVRPPSRGGK